KSCGPVMPEQARARVRGVRRRTGLRPHDEWALRHGAEAVAPPCSAPAARPPGASASLPPGPRTFLRAATPATSRRPIVAPGVPSSLLRRTPRGRIPTRCRTCPMSPPDVPSFGRDRLVSDLVALCEVDSTTGQEAALLPVLRRVLHAVGAPRIEELPVVGERVNVLATWSDAPRVLFSTHLDTVPPFIPPRVQGDRVEEIGRAHV